MLYARNILWQRSRWFALLIWLMIHAIAGISPAASGERGLLWKMESANTPTSYLFGTIHTDDERVREFSPKLKQAMQQCQSFMMEIAPASDMSAAFLPHGTLRDLLQPEEIDKVLRLVDQLAMHDEVALRMKPWLLAAVLSLPRPQSPWYQDVLLYYLANDLNLQLLGIETPAEHYSALDSLSQEEQLTLLRTVLDQTQEEKEKAFEMVLQAYLDKDVERILEADEQWSGATLPDALWDKVKSVLLDQRNARMAQRIEEQARKGAVFVAVGASHLPGEDGLIARLRRAGFVLSPIQ